MTLAVLPNFPLLNQRADATKDGRPPENADFDCVPESFAAAIEWYDGVPVSGDELKDAEYGEMYAGRGTALRRYVDNADDLARSKYHITAVPYTNTSTTWLVGRVHTWLREGYPVIATIPSAWDNAYDGATLASPPFSTHVICFYAEIDGGLVAMNPWGGFRHEGSDAYWRARLCYAQVWAVVRDTAAVAASTAPVTLQGATLVSTTAQNYHLPMGWLDDGKELHPPNCAFVVAEPFRSLIASRADWDPRDVPIENAVGTRLVETYKADPAHPDAGIGSIQRTNMHQMVKRASDGAVYLSDLGKEAKCLRDLTGKQFDQIKALRASLEAAQTQIATLLAHQGDPQATALLTQIRQLLATPNA